MTPLSRQLIQTRFATFLDKAEEEGEGGVRESEEVLMDERLADWNRLHGVRSVLLTGAFGMAVLGAVLSSVYVV
jgi:hypothetical protein